MRFRSLHLLRFGGFTDHRLEFGVEPGRVHLVYGANESGKSTTLRAVGDLLFGFGQHSGDGYLHGLSSLRVGATLLTDRGDCLELYRRKGRVKTLLDADDQPLAADPLGPLLGALDRAAFERLWGLDHERLRRGGEELLHGGGDVALGLVQAGAGLGSVRAVLEGLEAEADALFRPRGSTQRVNVALKQYAELESKVKQDSLSAEGFHRLERDLARAQTRLAGEERQLDALEVRRRQAERIRANLAPLARRKQLLAEAAALRGVPRLATDASARRLDAEQRLERARATLERLTVRNDERRTERQAQHLPEELLASAGKIRRLAKMTTLVAGAVDDLPRKEVEALAARRRVEQLLRDVRLDVAVEAAAESLPKPTQVKFVQALLEQRDALEHRCSELHARRAELDVELEAKAAELDAIPQQRDATAIDAAIKFALSLGGVEPRLQELEGDARLQRRSLAAGQGALPLFCGTLDELRSLAVPLDATVARFSQRWQDQQAELDACADRVEEARQATAAAAADHERLRAQGEVPTASAVATARAHREAGWELIRRRYIDGRDGWEQEASEFAKHGELPQAYERAVEAVDQLTDRRQHEAERAAHLEHAERGVRRCRESEAAWAQRLTAAEEGLAALRAEWERQWRGLQGPPLPPPEMREWLRQRAGLLQQADRLEGVERSLATERRSLQRACERLADALEPEGTPPESNAPLAVLFERAERVAQGARAQRERAAHLREDLGALGRKREQLRMRLAETDAELAQWRGQWDAALRGFGQSAYADPLEVRAMIEALAELKIELNQWQQLEHRVVAMRSNRDALEAAVAQLAPLLAPGATHLPPLEAAESLVDRLDVAERLSSRREQLDEEIVRAGEEMLVAEEEMVAMRGLLEQLRAAAGCESVTQLAEVEAQAQRRLQCEAELRELEQRLVEAGGGLSVEELAEEASSGDMEALNVEVRTLDRELPERGDSVKRAIEELAALRHERAGMTGSGDAAESAQRCQLVVERLGSDAEQWIVSRTAHELLRRALDLHREHNQGPVVGRASEQFKRLTLGGYQRLAVDYDARERPILQGVRADGKVVAVSAMSDGARDQLFLALRFAVLDGLLGKGELLPIVADDLLVQFDDNRAAAAIEALGQLARRTQVLYFTHHAMIVELARRTLPAGALAIHELP